MNLTSGMSKRFNKPFLCDEDTLRCVQATLKKSSTELSERNTKVVFHIEREDDRYYETSDIEDVLSDPNMNGKRICLTSIELRPIKSKTDPYEDWIAMVIFSFAQVETSRRKDFVIIRISSSNKNESLILSDELESQVQRTLNVKSEPHWILSLFVIPFILMGVKISSLFASIFARISMLSLFLASILMICWAAVDYISRYGLPKWFTRAFGPESAFLWGNEAKAYHDREKTRQKIAWGVVIAFLVCLIVSIVFAVFFTPLKLYHL